MTADQVEPQGNPLGRYDTGEGDDLHEVRLVGLPLRVLAAGREHHDELMREFAMLALDENLGNEHFPKRMLELIEVLGRRYGAASERVDAELDAALERGEITLDVVYHVPGHVTDAATQLEALMAEADEFCRRQQLLTLERPPILVDFARWYLDEFRRQIAGEPPRPWTGPLEP